MPLILVKPIFDIKDIEYKTNISTHTLSRSIKNVLYFGSLAARASLKAALVGLRLIPAQADQEVLSLDHQKGVLYFRIDRKYSKAYCTG